MTGHELQPDDDKSKFSRFTGTVLPGGVLWFEDDTLPASGSNTPIVISAPEEAVVLAEGEPVLQAFPQADAQTLQVVVRLYEYFAAVTRYPARTAEIIGSAYTTQPGLSLRPTKYKLRSFRAVLALEQRGLPRLAGPLRLVSFGGRGSGRGTRSTDLRAEAP